VGALPVEGSSLLLRQCDFCKQVINGRCEIRDWQNLAVLSMNRVCRSEVTRDTALENVTCLPLHSIVCGLPELPENFN